MCSESCVVKTKNLSKRYEIYATPKDRLRQMIMSKVKGLFSSNSVRYYDEFWALKNISVDIFRGETVGVIGANGSGKSTLLQLICGTLTPSEGEVVSAGRIAALLELGAGFNPEFTGEENIFLSGLLYGIGEADLKQRYNSIVEFSELGPFIKQPVKTYSSGMYVRLAFSIAAHVDADTLIIDEALSVGDVRFTQKCMRFLRKFQEGGTLLFVSHDTGAVANLCSRAIWLDQGQLRKDGSARDVIEEYLAEQHAKDRAQLGDRVDLIPSHNSEATVFQNEKVRGDNNSATEMEADIRLDLINRSILRNDIKIFDFDPPKSTKQFGAGKVVIKDSGFRAANEERVSLVVGGEIVELHVDAKVLDDVEGIIFGFYVKDRLGQRLFGDNTFITYIDNPIKGKRSDLLRCRFRFRMPILPVGPYSVDLAVATGTQEDHTQQHWIYDALEFRATDSSMRSGLVGIPMMAIDISLTEAESDEVYG